MKNFWIILQQTYLQSIRTKSYVWMTMILILLGAFLLALPSLMDKFTNEKDTGNYIFVSALPDFQVTQQQLDQFKTDAKFSLGNASELKRYKDEVIDKELDGLFVLNGEGNASSINLDYYMEKPDSLLIQQAKVFAQATYYQHIIGEKNVDQDVANLLMVQIEPVMQPLHGTNDNADLIILLLIGIMFMAITTYGNSVATAIAAEKSSRVMEVMITKTSPIPMMFGKIIGIGLASLTQLFFFLGSIVLFSRLELFKIDEGTIAHTMINMLTISYSVYFLLFFILGYFIYSALYAVVGSMASRPEELSSSTIPITIVLMGSLVVESMFVIDDPNGLTAKVTSYVPFTAPISLMLRIVNEVVSPLEIILSIGSMLVSIALFALLAAKIYPKGVLKTDQRLTFSQLLKNNS